MAERNPRFHFEAAGNGRTAVVETATGLIYRTLDNRSDAIAWLNEAEPPKK